MRLNTPATKRDEYEAAGLGINSPRSLRTVYRRARALSPEDKGVLGARHEGLLCRGVHLWRAGRLTAVRPPLPLREVPHLKCPWPDPGFSFDPDEKIHVRLVCRVSGSVRTPGRG